MKFFIKEICNIYTYMNDVMLFYAITSEVL